MTHPSSAYNDTVTITIWLESAIQDAERRGLPALRPLLENLARSTSALRSADWNDDASEDRQESSTDPDAR
jgi:hypothetical protein